MSRPYHFGNGKPSKQPARDFVGWKQLLPARCNAHTRLMTYPAFVHGSLMHVVQHQIVVARGCNTRDNRGLYMRWLDPVAGHLKSRRRCRRSVWQVRSLDQQVRLCAALPAAHGSAAPAPAQSRECVCGASGAHQSPSSSSFLNSVASFST